ncbi:GTP-binding protein [Cellulomonas sp. NPDC089187]|uniref:GTP-binding protein n=1 Tax=Cellulomonas sp. NPDC089187 TaxID=3154970 RepID=UPI00341B1AB3
MSEDASGRLTARLARLEQALTLAGDRIDPAVVDHVHRIDSQVRDRLALGVDHTVVALLGGTGSGKSSVFNAIAGFDFAEVGVRRPTTSRAAACVWGTRGEALLDWLQVDADRRIERESALDGDTEAPLRGLVLLDLPDHDSVDERHRETVDRLLPMADLLVWVVDPQKYADDALHSGYLRQLVGHEGAMVVLLNQVDLVPVEQQDALVADVQRLIEQDGLTGVPVRPVSARTGTGIAELRDLLAEVVRGQSLAARRGAAEVVDAARLVSAQLAAAEPNDTALEVAPVADRLAEAAGLPAIADAVAAAVRGGQVPVPSFVRVQAATVEQSRADWIERAVGSMPTRWAGAVRERVGSVTAIRQAADDALAQVAVVVRRSRAAALCSILAALCGVAAVAMAAIGVGQVLGGGRWADLVLPEGVATAVLVVLAVVLLLAGVRARRRAALRRADRVRQDGRTALGRVAGEQLADPTRAVLAEHRRVREAVAAALRD